MTDKLPMATLDADTDYDTEQVLFRIRRTLESCSKLIEAGDFGKSEKELSELAVFLNSISDAVVNSRNYEDEEDDLEHTAFQILTEFRSFITSSSLDQVVIDALSFELLKLAARFGCASRRCSEIAVSMVDSFADIGSPRDMLSVLSDALGSPSEMFRVPRYFIPLLTAFPKLFDSVKRRQFVHVKAAVPVILNALKSISARTDDDEVDATDVVELYQRVNGIADSVKTVCLKVGEEDSDKLRALLGLFVLQSLALLSMGIKHRKLVDSLPLVLHLSYFFPYCGLTYEGLITGDCVNNLLTTAFGDEQDDFVGCFSHIWLGASLAVIWGSKWNEVATAAEGDIAALQDELQSSQTKRWEAVGMLKHVFLCVHLPWELKQHSINFLLSVMEVNSSQATPCHPEAEFSADMPSVYTALQAVQAVIMYAPDAVIRRNAFLAFKKLLADLPTSLGFDILSAMIKNSDSSSMIALLLDCVREQMRAEMHERTVAAKSISNGESESSHCLCFWTADVLELVEMVLRPPGGGPPPLPEHCDAVLSALNLYRFILITESSGKTNYTGVRSKEHLKKVHGEWLLPLRTLVTGVAAENAKDQDQLALDISCGLNPVELVLYRCIEIVEEHLKQSS
ncbi:OLC1v1020133C1 [Oldenlandia corymbosa var. corymbosa]|uniref:OLC1v1020133C1 n=1 Tax=Oldenlandia corymbosa var. corymbosa TaxID=529605 RepID=A0AAV1EG32_OLDCO|nr:OLC1v1020133C1 [Oldenlandia corymbosa var. corymbosa]